MTDCNPLLRFGYTIDGLRENVESTCLRAYCAIKGLWSPTKSLSDSQMIKAWPTHSTRHI